MRSSLREIDHYLKETVKTIYIATGLHSIICDVSGNLLGDSGDEVQENSKLGENAMLFTCMKNGKSIIAYAPKTTYASCINCPRKDSCDVLATIEVPVLHRGKAIGGITLHADTIEKVQRLKKNEKRYLLFLESFAELIANRLMAENEMRRLEEQIDYGLEYDNIDFKNIISKSPIMEEVKGLARLVAANNSTILLTGESGTGKEIFARAIHHNSLYRNGPFVAVNCSAIPENLLESELFGYEGGSFTGSLKNGKIGKFEMANKGTLFLDEIGEFPLHLQAKLLRAIQEKRISRIGSTVETRLDFRIISATNRNLQGMVEQGEFRSDLFYRLNVIPIAIPPLRERVEDILPIMNYHLKRYNFKLRKQVEGFSKEAESIMVSYHWPGNVRELENIIEYAMNLSEGSIIEADALPAWIKTAMAVDATKSSNLKKSEEEQIRAALSHYGFTTEGKRLASQSLGISLATLYRKMKTYQIRQQDDTMV